MHVISVINYKGGVGKTTITANLGAELARRGRRVLLIDIDPQASLTFSFIPPEEWVRNYAESKTLRNWFQSFQDNQPINLRDIIFTPKKVAKRLKEQGSEGQLDLISSHLDLINIDLELATKLGGANIKEFSKNFLKIYGALSKGIQQLDSEDYDFVLIDCPPNFNIVTKAAIAASSHLLIPATPDYLSINGIFYLTKRHTGFINDYNNYIIPEKNESYSLISPSILGVIFNGIKIYKGNPIAILKEYMEKIKRLKYPVFESYLRYDKSILSDASAYGVPVILGNYGSKIHTDIINEMKIFVNEFENKIGVLPLVSANH